jgi:7-cyano-7-deazaguanine reductase
MSEINKIASKHLGQQNNYVSEYDPTLLVKIPRTLNRLDYGINDTSLPFSGYDVWNAYEVSALTLKGLPVNVVAKIVIPCQSECIIESKSLKLYLNSFNMTKLGSSSNECISELKNLIKADIESLLEANISIFLFESQDNTVQSHFLNFPKLNKLVNLDNIHFNHINSGKEILEVCATSSSIQSIAFQSNLLRSNCRVTNQPDWGDLFVLLKTNHIPDYTSIAKYIVSHRKINHFHEEVAEMFFMHFLEKFQPDALMIACLYTRRGGIDINPIRTTDPLLIPDDFISNNLNAKTLRQ